MFAIGAHQKITILLKGEEEPLVFLPNPEHYESGDDEMIGMSKGGMFGIYDNIWLTNTAQGVMRPNLKSDTIQAEPKQVLHERRLFPLDAIKDITIDHGELKIVPMIILPKQKKIKTLPKKEGKQKYHA